MQITDDEHDARISVLEENGGGGGGGNGKTEVMKYLTSRDRHFTIVSFQSKIKDKLKHAKTS